MRYEIQNSKFWHNGLFIHKLHKTSDGCAVSREHIIGTIIIYADGNENQYETPSSSKCVQCVCAFTLYYYVCVWREFATNYGTRLISIENRSHLESRGGGGSLVGSSCARVLFSQRHCCSTCIRGINSDRLGLHESRRTRIIIIHIIFVYM